MACGLCLPHCPTYRKTGDENESPRGRIALMRAQALGQLPHSARLQAHLDHCLSCRACERVCPSQVHYGDLRDAVYARAWPRVRQRPLVRLLLGAVASPRALRRLGAWLHWLSRSRLGTVLATIPGLRHAGVARLLAQLPAPLPQPVAWAPLYPAADRRGAVTLFLGCVARSLDDTSLRAAVRVLTTLGYDVHVPAEQGCCGALHQHAGDQDTAGGLRAYNIEAFARHASHPIIVLATGCAATLREYGRHAGTVPAEQFAARVTDINTFLARIAWPPQVRLAPLPARIAVHDPCSLVHVLREEASVYQLLARLPAAEVVALPDNRLCCGAAGSYFLTQPTMAEALRADKLAAIRALAPDVLVTSNLGCARHLAAGLGGGRAGLEILHPVTLLARQLLRDC